MYPNYGREKLRTKAWTRIARRSLEELVAAGVGSC